MKRLWKGAEAVCQGKTSTKGAEAVCQGKTSTIGASVDTDPKNIYAAKGAAENFTASDKLNISGTLSDGRSINLELEAGKDFAIGSNLEVSLGNVVTKLADTNLKVTLTGSGEVKVADIFGTSKEMTVAKNGTDDLPLRRTACWLRASRAA